MQTRQKRYLYIFIITLLLFVPWAVAQDKAAKIDQLMSTYHGLRQFNGTVLVAEGGKVIFKRGYGLANMEWNIPNQPDTKFRLGSITKQFTSMLALQLVEQEKLRLDGKLSDYLPEYPKKVGERVTVHQLLNHTSGIPSYTGFPGLVQNESRNPYTPAEFIQKFLFDKELEFEPGARFAYNNSGYFLLGAMIEKVTGQPYEKVLQQRILDPLGMKDTGYDHWETLLPKRATGYEKLPGGYRTAPYLDMTLPYAAGSLYSTAEDLYRWDQALYTDKLLPARLKEVMFKPGLGNYAYGWMITKVPQDEPAAGATLVAHGGGINGFSSLISRLTDARHLIVLLNNTGGARLSEMARNIYRVLYNLEPSKLKKPLGEELCQAISEGGLEAAERRYKELKSRPYEYDLREPELNTLGYGLLRSRRFKEAIQVFTWNVEAYPKSANVYDSLAEAYAEAGDKEAAIRNYAKSLELNPKNVDAIDKLKKIVEKK